MLNDGQRKGKKASPLSGSTIISRRILFSSQYFLTQWKNTQLTCERHKVWPRPFSSCDFKTVGEFSDLIFWTWKQGWWHRKQEYRIIRITCTGWKTLIHYKNESSHLITTSFYFVSTDFLTTGFLIALAWMESVIQFYFPLSRCWMLAQSLLLNQAWGEKNAELIHKLSYEIPLFRNGKHKWLSNWYGVFLGWNVL